jgi:hypothetical protein
MYLFIYSFIYLFDYLFFHLFIFSSIYIFMVANITNMDNMECIQHHTIVYGLI